MISFKKRLLGEKFLDDLCASYERGQKRNLLLDCRQFLKINKIKYSAFFQQGAVLHTATIIVSNHYARSLFVRKSPFTTIDSMITSAIITTELARISKRKPTWVIKDSLVKNIFFYNLKPRQAQIAAIYDYDLIGVSANYPFSKKDIWRQRLASGYNIALYPEGAISTKLTFPKKGFEEIIKYLEENNMNVQILPVGIYYKHGIFIANFGKTQKVESLENLTQKVMLEIAALLPQNLRGRWQIKKDNFKAQAVQQQVGGQIPELAQLPETAT